MHARVLLVVALLALFVLPAGLALADNGPHGGSTATTDACAGCHRAHTAGAARLLISAVPNLCFTCHGRTGSGADTNVVDGVNVERDSTAESPAEGVTNRGLKAGGFVNATMDTDWNLLSAPAAVTSSHLNDGSTGTDWGNGTLGSGDGAANFSLSCASCHDPHGRAGTGGAATYCLLRAVPLGSGAAGGVNVTDETSKFYTVSNGDNQYFGENYGSRGPQLALWCRQCHTRYDAPSGSGSTYSGDPIFAYRHMTTDASVNCVNCHVAHGTTASMGANSGAVRWPDGATTPSGNSRSSLLRVDNRGVCELCHGM